MPTPAPRPANRGRSVCRRRSERTTRPRAPQRVSGCDPPPPMRPGTAQGGTGQTYFSPRGISASGTRKAPRPLPRGAGTALPPQGPRRRRSQNCQRNTSRLRIAPAETRRLSPWLSMTTIQQPLIVLAFPTERRFPLRETRRSRSGQSRQRRFRPARVGIDMTGHVGAAPRGVDDAGGRPRSTALRARPDHDAPRPTAAHAPLPHSTGTPMPASSTFDLTPEPSRPRTPRPRAVRHRAGAKVARGPEGEPRRLAGRHGAPAGQFFEVAIF